MARKTELGGEPKGAVKVVARGEDLEGVALVERAIEIVLSDPCRPKGSDKAPGGLVELPRKARPIIIGDLHANLDP